MRFGARARVEWQAAASYRKEAQMAYTHADHPFFWEVTHHPMIAILVALVVGAVAALLWLYGTPAPEALGLTDANIAP